MTGSVAKLCCIQCYHSEVKFGHVFDAPHSAVIDLRLSILANFPRITAEICSQRVDTLHTTAQLPSAAEAAEAAARSLTDRTNEAVDLARGAPIRFWGSRRTMMTARLVSARPRPPSHRPARRQASKD